MKVLNTITICILFSLAFISCGDDDPVDDMTPTEMGLEGDWKATSFFYEASTTIDAGGVAIGSTATGVASNLDYTLNLDGASFLTKGTYDIDNTISVTGMNDIVSNQSYNVDMGSGTYTTTDDQITVDGQLFDFEVEGVSATQVTGPVTATYVIEGDVLTFTQDEESTTEIQGIESVVRTKSTSVWARQ